MKGMILGCILAGLAACSYADEPAAETQGVEMKRAQGTFDVKLSPQPEDAAAGPFSRLFLDKTFHGDLTATSKGQMLGAQTQVKGSGGYVALELVTGTLHDKKGSFILLHKGTMKGGNFQLDISVVPDSGTEELSGIAGTMMILIEGSKHSYELSYTLDSK